MMLELTFFLVEYGSRTNQVEANEHVTSRTNHTGMREIQRLYSYEMYS